VTAWDGFRGEFGRLLQTYLRSDDEEQLFEAAEFGRRLIEREVGPEELVAVHLDAVQVALRDLPPARIQGAVLKSYNLLLEAVMAYGLTYRDHLRAERRHAEEARHQADQIAARERELRIVVDSLRVGLLLLDQTGRVRLANPVVERLIRPGAADLVGRVLESGDVPLLDEWLDQVRAAARGADEKLDEWETERDGRCWQVQVLPIAADARATPMGALVLLRDITRHREVQRLKDELVSVVSHELRTPLAVVLGFAELMVQRDLDPQEMRNYAGLIHEESGRLIGLLNEFLDLQRLESGRARFRCGPVALAPLCHGVAQRLATSGARHRLIVDVPDALPPVLADPDRLVQVLTNLVSNAVKYSPAGGDVTIAAVSADEQVVLRVTDQGLGLPHEALTDLFDKFYRVDTPDRRGIGGTGLGLAICRQIVEGHGGRIWAESDGPGHGSAFSFTLPAAPRRAVQAAS
jgi:PAS domain S-box-containing protein